MIVYDTIEGNHEEKKEFIDDKVIYANLIKELFLIFDRLRSIILQLAFLLLIIYRSIIYISLLNI